MSKSLRSSQRSRTTISTVSSSPSNLPRKRVKRCCRNFVTFMCTQVGVGALIVFYAICGALSFMEIERYYKDEIATKVYYLRQNCSQELWNITEELNIFDKKKWQSESDKVLKNYQIKIAEEIQKGYTGRTPEEMWSFPAALMFCLSLITMIGYGNLVPRTPWGKGFTVIYATFGIPIYILYFLSIGRVLARSFKFIYRRMHDCTRDRMQETLENGSVSIASQRKKMIVPSTACLWVIFFYILTGTIMFASWEGWSPLNSFYFCMTSLCKIGLGDFVPGAQSNDKVADQNSKLAINFIYMLLGMGLVAMCYNLMREEVRVKLKEMKEDTKLCFEDTRARFTGCCGQSDYYEDDYY